MSKLDDTSWMQAALVEARAAQQAEQHAAASAAADEAQLLPHTPAPHPAELARHMTDPSITIPYES